MDRKPILQSSQQDDDGCESQPYTSQGDQHKGLSNQSYDTEFTGETTQSELRGRRRVREESPVSQGQSQGEGQTGGEGHRSGPCDDRIEDAESDPRPEGTAVGRVLASKNKRLAVLTLISFLTACNVKLFHPLITQYTYQFYTEQVYGNLSHGVHVNSHPCVNTTSSHNASSNHTDTREQQVQDLSADFLSRASMINGGVAIVVNVFLGSYSDFLGRKLVLFLPILGYFLQSAILPVVIYWDLGINAMYVGYLLDGLMGGAPAVAVGMFAYTADVTAGGGERTFFLALVEFAAHGLGLAPLHLLAGLFIRDVGFFYPSIVAAGLSLITLVLIAMMPETVSRDRKRVTSLYKMPCRLVRTFLPADNVYRRALLLLTLLIGFGHSLPYMTFGSIQALYLMDRPFCWDSYHQGLFGTVFAGTSYVVSLVVIKVLKNRVAAPYLTIIGLTSDIGKCIMFALANSNLMIYLATIAAACRQMAVPPLRSILSTHVPKENQGAAFAGVAILESIAVFAGPAIFMPLYKGSLTFMAGFVFLCVAGIDFLNILASIVNLRLWKRVQGSQRMSLSVQAEK